MEVWSNVVAAERRQTGWRRNVRKAFMVGWG
jgi:hypothetical protein